MTDKEKESLMSAGLKEEEIDEILLVEDYVSGGKEPPEEIEKYIDLIRRCRANELFKVINGTDFATHIMSVMGDIRRMTVETNELSVEIVFPKEGDTVSCWMYPLDNGRRVYVRELLGDENPADDLSNILK